MVEIVFNKVLMMTFMMAVLNVLRHLFFVVQIMTKAEKDREPYKLTWDLALLLGLSISFIMTSIFTGIYL